MEQIDVGLENWVANLAARLQLDSPAPSRPPLVSSGASSSSADAALGQAPIQSAASLELLQELQRGLAALASSLRASKDPLVRPDRLCSDPN